MDPNVVFILEVIGTVTFAFSGAYVAINQDLDWLKCNFCKQKNKSFF